MHASRDSLSDSKNYYIYYMRVTVTNSKYSCPINTLISHLSQEAGILQPVANWIISSYVACDEVDFHDWDSFELGFGAL